MISNLKPMYVYESLNNHAVIPVKEMSFGWLCQVFYWNKDANEVLDQGFYEYTNEGICINDKTKFHNVVKQTATQNLHPRLRAAVKEWKQFYKKEN